ncbi:hypothetical protein [Mesorhizobium sp. M0088]|uniref:hypothetical protein n=1 Tax=Mesorhizobium sp. M0088 TaxID=2956873 RepID=UPI0033360601
MDELTVGFADRGAQLTHQRRHDHTILREAGRKVIPIDGEPVDSRGNRRCSIVSDQPGIGFGLRKGALEGEHGCELCLVAEQRFGPVVANKRV